MIIDTSLTTLSGDLLVLGDLYATNLNVQTLTADSVIFNTSVITSTSALSVINTNPEITALTVKQSPHGTIATFVNGDNNTVANITQTGIFGLNLSGEGSSIYNVSGSEKWSSVYNNVNELSGSWNSNYTTTNNNSANYILDGGNTKGTNLLIGTNDNFNLTLETNNTPRITILNSGNVGIGTTSPSEQLTVIGNTTISNSLTALSLSASQITVTAGTSAVPVISPANDTNTGIYFPAADTIAFSEGGAEAMRINSSGNVGIGVTSLLTNLHIRVSELAGYTSVANSGLLIERGDNSVALNLAGPNTHDSIIWFADQNSASVGGIIYNHPSNYMGFRTNASERLRIDSDGDVSIGTATALSKLHVHGNITLSNTTTATSAGTGGLTLPASAAGYLTVSINGTSRKIPYYAT